jgi:hypothetical protein
LNELITVIAADAGATEATENAAAASTRKKRFKKYLLRKNGDCR